MAKVTSRLQVMITPATDGELDRLAKRHGQPKAVLVRAALNDLVERAEDEDTLVEELLVDQADRETPLDKLTDAQRAAAARLKASRSPSRGG